MKEVYLDDGVVITYDRRSNGKMDMDIYQRLAMRTKADYRDRTTQMTNAALGLAGESGEVADMIKKWLDHGHSMDFGKLEKELGDILWYIAEMCDAMDGQLSEVARRNIEKLRARYPDGFQSAQSINKDESKE